MTYLLALDQGTSSSRSIVFDAQGRIVAMAQREFRQIYPQPGWVEHDPMEIWAHAARHRARGAGQGRAARRPTSRAIGITNQRETTRGVEPPHRRADPQRHRLAGPPRRADLRRSCAQRGLAEPDPRKTGLVIDAYFSGTKLKWILDNVPGARAAARARRARLRHRRQLADVAAHRRRACTPPT